MADRSNPAEMLLYLGCSSESVLRNCPALLGCPLDRTSTYRSGSDSAPEAVRTASDSIETYSPLLKSDLLDHPFADLGDLTFEGMDLHASLDLIHNAVSNLVGSGAKALCLGGEHTVTLPIVRAVREKHPDLVVIQCDAHADLRHEYDGSEVNHATVMRRVVDVIGPDRLLQLGIRSGTREEYEWMEQQGTLVPWDDSTREKIVERVGSSPVHLTLDLDVLDPSLISGTGNPEAGGWPYARLEEVFLMLERLNVVSADVVELNPGLDPSEVSSITAAKIVRELLLILSTSQ